MGKIRTLTVKRAAKKIISLHSDKFKADFNYNKQKLPDVAVITSKKLRNWIAGYIVSLKKLEAKGKRPRAPVIIKEKKPGRERRPIRGGRKEGRQKRR